jgi:hypothetical protein
MINCSSKLQNISGPLTLLEIEEFAQGTHGAD